ncbi:MAG: bifunctional diguanylate cyclase/phosphodiesterase, partial [Xanthobacteraceae bacterium]
MTFLGLIMAACVVAGAWYLADKDRIDNYDSAVRNGANLSRVFEGYISRTMKSADNSLRFLRHSYSRNPSSFDMAAWSRDADFQNDLMLQLTVVGADGYIKASTYGPNLKGIYIGDREHFQVHVNSTSDNLFISKPVLLRTQDKWAIILSRRIVAEDGSFAGIISAAIDPAELEEFYNSLDLGREGIISLAGFDGVIRARSGTSQSHGEGLGRSIEKTQSYKRFRSEPTGNYWNVPGTVDGVPRLMTYRVVDGLPLIALVGLSKTEIFAEARENQRIYYAIAAALLAAIAMAIAYGTARAYKLNATTTSLARTNARFETALSNLPHGLCMFDEDQKLIVCNDLYGEMYKVPPELLEYGTPFKKILNASVAAGNVFDDVMINPFDKASEYVSVLRDKKIRGTAADYAAHNKKTGTIYSVHRRPLPGGGWIAIHQDVTAQKRAEAEIRHLAHYDGLTSLANRMRFLDRVGKAAELNRRSGARFAIHLLDLDRFKEVNDTLGHIFGDKLLKIVAQRLTAVARTSDLVARLGGDEFAVLQKLDPDERDATGHLAENILAIFRDPFDIDGQQIVVETSIGISLLPDHGMEAEQLLKNADLALYKAKSEGRNTYRLFEEDMELDAQSKRSTETDLRAAIARDEFELHYQPIIDIASSRTIAFEALVRWRHPERGLVAPDQFIPIAEDTGLIAQLGEWVLRRACSDAAQWPEHIRLAVNLSPAQFRRRNLVDTISDALASSGLWPGRLELEITETVLLQDDDENLAILHQLRALGISIVLDDFGTGYSSLSYLQRFPFDKIKIDRSFVANLTSRPDCAAIVCAVTGLARALDITTTAEGVETREQLDLLRAAGCMQVQGFLYGRPCPQSELDFSDTSRTKVAAA